MAKKYKITEPEPMIVNEPSGDYNVSRQQQGPCVFTIEEIEEQIAQEKKDKEAGLGIPHEELKKCFKA